MFMSGDKFGDMLMNLKGTCPNCGTTNTFEESGRLAKQHDIKDNVVMCKGCKSVFTIDLNPRSGMTFVADVTAKYPSALAAQALPKPSAAEKPAPPPQTRIQALPAPQTVQPPAPASPAALRTCPQCGQQSNMSELVCPHCGQVFWISVISMGFVVLLFIGILVIISSFAFSSGSTGWIIVAVIIDLLLGIGLIGLVTDITKKLRKGGGAR